MNYNYSFKALSQILEPVDVPMPDHIRIDHCKMFAQKLAGCKVMPQHFQCLESPKPEQRLRPKMRDRLKSEETRENLTIDERQTQDVEFLLLHLVGQADHPQFSRTISLAAGSDITLNAGFRP
jgi:hypothetical protein